MSVRRGAPQRRVTPGPRSAAATAVAATVLLGCGVIELGTLGVAGEVAEPATPVDDDEWQLLLVVEPNTIRGVTGDLVAVRFDPDELACVDGAALGPEAVEVGWRVNLDRQGDEVHGADPPVVTASSLAVDCPVPDEFDG